MLAWENSNNESAYSEHNIRHLKILNTYLQQNYCKRDEHSDNHAILIINKISFSIKYNHRPHIRYTQYKWYLLLIFGTMLSIVTVKYVEHWTAQSNEKIISLFTNDIYTIHIQCMCLYIFHDQMYSIYRMKQIKKQICNENT